MRCEQAFARWKVEKINVKRVFRNKGPGWEHLGKGFKEELEIDLRIHYDYKKMNRNSG